MLPVIDLSQANAAAFNLREGYLTAGVLASRSSDDALHVAMATVNACSVIASWNFRHIVHFDRIPLYNAVNVIQGFSEIQIHSPLEIIDYADEEEV